MFFVKKQPILSVFSSVLLGLLFAHSAIAMEQCHPSALSKGHPKEFSNPEPVFAQCNPISDGNVLNVAVRHAPPFVYEIFRWCWKAFSYVLYTKQHIFSIEREP